MADALDKVRYFVLGCNHLVIAVDHKPLRKIFGDRFLNQISNPRLRNLKEKPLDIISEWCIYQELRIEPLMPFRGTPLVT